MPCEYLDGPGDLESTALRERFSDLEDQIHSLIKEFDLIEELVYDQRDRTPQQMLRTEALRPWEIRKEPHGGCVFIETHMHHVEDIYATLIQFALDNTTIPSPPSAASTTPQPACLTRNNAIYPTIKLSHFTSLLTEHPSSNTTTTTTTAQLLDDSTLRRLFDLYPTCLLFGAIPECEALLLTVEERHRTPLLELLRTSTLCYMLLHACCWHSDALPLSKDDCTRLADQYYQRAKELISTVYFEDPPSVIACHALYNLVLYHIESGNTSVIYLYSGMAARMAASLNLYAPPDQVEALAQQEQAVLLSSKRYMQSVGWFLYFLDTAAAHFHDKPYQVILASPPAPRNNDAQSLFQWLEFQACEIARDIRHTCFASDRNEVPYKEIERIEQKLKALEALLPPRHTATTNNMWETRCAYVHWIRHHGHWILLHQTYLPTPLSLERCTKAAFALVDLFTSWNIDCYFRPCIHELKQACEILEYHVDNDTEQKAAALTGLARLLNVILTTPVRDIARTRPFIQKIQQKISSHNITI